MKKVLVILTAVTAIALPAQAQVYKCQEGGKAVFSDKPCGVGAKVIDATPAAGEGDPSEYNSSAARLQRNMEYLREKEQREDAARERRYAEEARAKQLAESDRKQQIRRCNDIRARIDRNDAHLKERLYADTRRYYAAEKEAATQQFQRECTSQ